MGEDPLGESQAFNLATTSEALCETAFYIGALAWARDETLHAQVYFEQAVGTNVHLYMEHAMAKIMADRLRARQETAKRLPDMVGGETEKPAPVQPVNPVPSEPGESAVAVPDETPAAAASIAQPDEPQQSAPEGLIPPGESVGEAVPVAPSEPALPPHPAGMQPVGPPPLMLPPSPELLEPPLISPEDFG
ncbi:MAG: hypothetical protein LIP23_07295 [Planctomycetes bacterium]|nr:hypothetical protein [Planctomycetota bacterium]